MATRCLRVSFNDARRTKIRPDRERGFSNHQQFSDYALGRKFTIESLIPLLNSKNLDSLPPRVVRFRLRLAIFDYIVNHVPGTADTLSRAPLPEVGDAELEEEVQAFVDSATQSLPATRERLDLYKTQEPVYSCTSMSVL